jgi:hypothetical protein
MGASEPDTRQRPALEVHLIDNGTLGAGAGALDSARRAVRTRNERCVRLDETTGAAQPADLEAERAASY